MALTGGCLRRGPLRNGGGAFPPHAVPLRRLPARGRGAGGGLVHGAGRQPALRVWCARHPPLQSAGRTQLLRACGTPLTYRNDAYAQEIDVLTCSLDDPEAAAPQDHTWASQRLGWMRVDDLPAYPRSRGEGGGS
jgi:hypothetical protein